MLLEILKESDPRLREKSQPVRKINKEIRQLVSDMMETMRLKNGIGLSAIQVGKPFCILVFDVGQEFGILINPKIVANSGDRETEFEGCLSLNERIKVDRDKEILVQYYNLDGVLTERTFTGLSARVVQHEMDHFDGRLITDYED